MTPQEFTNWLDEMLKFNSNLTELNSEQTKLIKDKLDTVFNKVTPELNENKLFPDFENPPVLDCLAERIFISC